MSLVRWGAEVSIPQSGGVRHSDPYVVATSGGYLLVWEFGFGLAARRYDAGGTQIGDTRTLPDGSDPAAAVLPSGEFAISYTAVIHSWPINYNIALSRFSASGEHLGTITANPAQFEEGNSALIATANAFVAVWESNYGTPSYLDIRSGMFSGSLVQTSAQSVSPTGSDLLALPDITRLADGRFVVAWADNGVRLRLLDANGVPQGAMLSHAVSFSTAEAQVESFGGGFLVAWADYAAQAVKARFFTSAGSPIGVEILVSQTPGFQGLPQIGKLSTGGFVIAWSAPGEADGVIRARAFDAGGAPLSDELVVSTTLGVQRGPVLSLTVLEDDRVLIAWSTDDGAVRTQVVDPRAGLFVGRSASEQIYGAETLGDTLNGAGGEDVIFGLGGEDRLFGGEGRDRVFGNAGNDLLWGGAAADVLNGGVGSDTLLGEQGDDVVYGEGGEDVLFGGEDADILNGGLDSDLLSGGSGDDVLIGAAGGDRLIGGFGDDAFWWLTPDEGDDLIDDYAPDRDQLLFSGAAFGVAAGGQLQGGLTFIFGSAPAASQAEPTFLYDTDDGSLYFDPDGSGPAAVIFIVRLQGAPQITVGDFSFV